MKHFSYILSFCLILLIGCTRNKINVTSQYIEFTKNPVFVNGFQLSLITVKDNKTPPQQYTEVEGGKYGILTDSTFKLSNKIYFDRKQKGFKWVRLDGGEKIDSIGHLINNHWYLIKNLHHLGYKIFVHITDNGQSEVYIDHRENW
jgi:hypothetical protein